MGNLGKDYVNDTLSKQLFGFKFDQLYEILINLYKNKKQQNLIKVVYSKNGKIMSYFKLINGVSSNSIDTDIIDKINEIQFERLLT